MLEALSSAIPVGAIQEVVDRHQLWRQRKRKLSAEIGIALIIAMNLFSQNNLAEVLRNLLKGYRYVWAKLEPVPANKSAISQVRYAIGAKAVADLYHQVCRPMTIPDNLTVVRGGAPREIQSLDFEVKKGEVVAIIG